MSESLLFGIGSLVFIVVTTAILMFGYARFNELYGRDRDAAVAGEPGLELNPSATSSD